MLSGGGGGVVHHFDEQKRWVNQVYLLSNTDDPATPSPPLAFHSDLVGKR
jgi:hypothetical protein